MKTNVEYTKLFREKHPDYGVVTVGIIDGKIKVTDGQYTEWYRV